MKTASIGINIDLKIGRFLTRADNQFYLILYTINGSQFPKNRFAKGKVVYQQICREKYAFFLPSFLPLE